MFINKQAVFNLISTTEYKRSLLVWVLVKLNILFNSCLYGQVNHKIIFAIVSLRIYGNLHKSTYANYTL